MPIIQKREAKTGREWLEARLKVQGKVVVKVCKTWQEASTWINEQRYLRDKQIVGASYCINMSMLFNDYLAFAKNKGRALGTTVKAQTYFDLYLKSFKDLSTLPFPSAISL